MNEFPKCTVVLSENENNCTKVKAECLTGSGFLCPPSVDTTETELLEEAQEPETWGPKPPVDALTIARETTHRPPDPGPRPTRNFGDELRRLKTGDHPDEGPHDERI